MNKEYRIGGSRLYLGRSIHFAQLHKLNLPHISPSTQLKYPDLPSPNTNEWLQSSNPAIYTIITGFQPVALSYKLNGLAKQGFAGLGLNSNRANGGNCVIDDLPTYVQWWYCIGPLRAFNENGFPGPVEKLVRYVEMYAKRKTG